MSCILRVATCATLLGPAGCTVGPDFTPPAPVDAAHWNDPSARRDGDRAAVSQATNPDPEWWDGLGDPVLTALTEKAIKGNLDLQQAVLRVIEAHQGEISAGAQGMPALGANGSYSRTQLGAKGILESKGAYRQLDALADQNSPLNRFRPGLGNEVRTVLGGALSQITQPSDLYQYGLSASWEVDLFGKVRRSVEQAGAKTEAAAEATNDALVMLEGEVAQAYVQLRGAQDLAASQRENVRTARETFELTQRRQQHGLTTELDVEQARTQLDDNERQLPGFDKQIEQAMNSLSVLIGEPPGTLDATLAIPAPLPKIPQIVGVGIPSTLARRRPDIREAEAQLHAATANIGVAVASFYPDISLTGSLGLRALDASYVTNWASHFYSVGPSISLPIFEGGRLTAGLRLARAQAAEAALAYRAVVLNSLREVENALVAYRTDRVARDKSAETVSAAKTTLYLARNRYEHGMSDFIQVLDAERTLISARQQLIQADIALISDVVALYRALGGGWEKRAGDITVPSIDPTPPPLPAALDSVASGTVGPGLPNAAAN
ncbi:MAG: transporter [Rhodospirillales bacterium]|nr:transporter [Rhodospirillales bacterium]